MFHIILCLLYTNKIKVNRQSILLLMMIEINIITNFISKLQIILLLKIPKVLNIPKI